MQNRNGVRSLLIVSSLAGGALLAGCVGEVPEDSARASATPNNPAPVESPVETAQAEGKAASAFTQAEDSNTYAVYVEHDGAARKVTSVRVNGHVNELTVETNAAPSGGRVAIVPNYDTFAGTELRVVDSGADGAERVLEDARAASPVWSSDSAELAYLVMRNKQFDVRISDGVKAGNTIATIDALRARILGWSRDKKEIYLIRDLDQEHGLPLVAFGVLDVATGKFRTTFESDMVSSTYYRDFQLVETDDGSVNLSFIKSTTPFPCGGTNSLQLATVNGTLLSGHGETKDSYSQVRWSPDGKQVAYEVRACADKPQGLAKAQERMEAINGIHIAQVGEVGSKRVASGLLRDYRLSGLRGGDVMLDSSTRGMNVLKAMEKPVDLHQFEADLTLTSAVDVTAVVPPGILSAKNMTAQYVHQLWDTPDWFNGNSACGPTSSLMALAGYQLGAWPMAVSYPSAHTSQYGQYVAVQYSYNGYTFSTAGQDPSGTWAKGAYGHMVHNPNVGSSWADVNSYLDRHVPWAVGDADASIGANWVKQQINGNLLVVTSGSVFGYGHLILIRGYTDDGRWYVNDPFGYQVSGNFNGANVIYTWANISPKHFWAA